VISFADLQPVIIGGCAVAMVAFADTSVLSRTYAAKTRTPVDPNQEMIGLGAANLAGGLFQGFPISSSSSRTPVAEAAGAKTQVTGVVGAIAWRCFWSSHPICCRICRAARSPLS
jgi:MFS superfamily sulfate permease-like transporter